MLERIRKCGAEEISVVPAVSKGATLNEHSSDDLHTSARVAQHIEIYKRKGFDAVLIASSDAYIECDLAVLLGSHRAHGETITRAYDQDGALDLWMVDPARFDEREEIIEALRTAQSEIFELPGYVNRLQTAADFRRFCVDMFGSRCQARPSASEVKPGVWIAEGAQVARAARVVAPAFVGRGVRIAEDCLITRCSNIECNSYVDFGTAVEDTSILPNTYIGIGLDLSHSVVDGGQVLNLRHNVKLQITDPVVMRRSRSRTSSQSPEEEFDARAVALS
jgi:ADP-glucose pyrophosphorylase